MTRHAHPSLPLSQPAAGQPDDLFRNDSFRISLSVFEGPVDLLLYLVRKNEIDIHEIPIARITREYLEYVDLLTMIDLDSAGDFLVIASKLLRLKSRSMFDNPGEDEADEATVTRDQLLRYLMEFEKLGAAVDKLAEKEQERIMVYPRPGERSRIGELEKEQEPEPDFFLFDLLTALKDVLKNAPKTTPHDVELLNVTSEMKQTEIMLALDKHGELDFVEFVTGQPKLIIVITFIAMLELMKALKITVRQPNQFGRILIHARIDHE
jgi:segregation and condensation protein A